MTSTSHIYGLLTLILSVAAETQSCFSSVNHSFSSLSHPHEVFSEHAWIPSVTPSSNSLLRSTSATHLHLNNIIHNEKITPPSVV